jgi:hypothetical protein
MKLAPETVEVLPSSWESLVNNIEPIHGLYAVGAAIVLAGVVLLLRIARNYLANPAERAQD